MKMKYYIAIGIFISTLLNTQNKYNFDILAKFNY